MTFKFILDNKTINIAVLPKTLEELIAILEKEANIRLNENLDIFEKSKDRSFRLSDELDYLDFHEAHLDCPKSEIINLYVAENTIKYPNLSRTSIEDDVSTESGLSDRESPTSIRSEGSMKLPGYVETLLALAIMSPKLHPDDIDPPAEKSKPHEAKEKTKSKTMKFNARVFQKSYAKTSKHSKMRCLNQP